ncbi:unnamed protein product [Musa acuminata subsp. burmannicoides]
MHVLEEETDQNVGPRGPYGRTTSAMLELYRYMYMSCVCLHPTREKQKEQRNVWDSRRCTVELSARVSLHEGSSLSFSAASVPMDIREASMRGSDAYGCDNTHKTKLIRPQFTMW